MTDLESLQSKLRCPYCRSSSMTVLDENSHLICDSCRSRYFISFGRPVMIRSDNSIFSPDSYQKAKAPSKNHDRRNWKNVIPGISVNLASQRVLGKVSDLLEKKTRANVLVVGSGCQRKWLDELICTGENIQLVYSDIDIDADVDLFCDAHDLPFVDGVFDAVVTTAVLEHVLYPERVAAEITRVLSTGGILYSELPFMQQVHEGAYDFTRYTLSGHRRLFNHIDEIESGIIAGPATALVWAIENFALAFMQRPLLRKVTKVMVRLAFSWSKYFDFLLSEKPSAMDGASCTYLLGSKIEEHIPDSEIVSRYVGAKHMRHI